MNSTEDFDLFGEPVTKLKTLDRDMLERGIAASIIGISERELADILQPRTEAVIEFARLCRGQNAGQRISLCFNAHRLSTPTIMSESITAALQRPAFARGLARALAFKDGLVRDLLYQVLQLGINGIQYVNEFPPHVARDLFCSFNARRVLDPCAGWGGRMIGAAAVGAFYHGFEPSTRTFDGLNRLGEFLKTFETGFDFKVECVPFEDATIVDQYDLALTSPPYFDTERYSDEPTNAGVRYATFEAFVEGFFVPLIRKATNASTNGLILNIGSRRYPLRDVVQASGFDVKTLEGGLSGKGGMSKGGAVGEEFFHITKVLK